LTQVSPFVPAATLSIWSSVSRIFSAPAGNAQSTIPRMVMTKKTLSFFMPMTSPVEGFSLIPIPE
jgi:hypothetical protein